MRKEASIEQWKTLYEVGTRIKGTETMGKVLGYGFNWYQIWC